MTDPASRDAGIPPRVHPIEVLKVRATDTHYVRFLGPLRQLGTHFAGKSRAPLVCWGHEPGRCRNHKLPYKSKWYAPALVYIYDEKVWRRCVVEATEPLERQLRGKVLRGQEWCLRKVKPNPQAKYVQIEGLFIDTPATGNLPEAFPVDPVLQRVFGELELPPPETNFLPERPFAPDEPGAPPTVLVEQIAEEERTARVLSVEELREANELLKAKLGIRSRPVGRPAPAGPLPRPSTNGVNGAH